jgi:hypothetical protein
LKGLSLATAFIRGKTRVGGISEKQRFDLSTRSAAESLKSSDLTSSIQILQSGRIALVRDAALLGGQCVRVRFAGWSA